MINRIRPFNFIIESFRRFKNINFELGNKITVISGQNGVGKSNLISLIASCSGISRKSVLGSNFQPEFYDFFNIDKDENYENYKLYLSYIDSNKQIGVTKRLAFKNDTKTGRGIRIIPRTTNKFSPKKTIKEVECEAKEHYNVGGAARVNIPTIYLSLSRLYPLGERKETVTITVVNRKNQFYQKKANEKYKEWYNFVIPNSVREETSLLIINKKMCARPALHMNIIDTPALSQSIGQDNIGNIISALVDIYMLSLEKDYSGALLCIDEIEVSLHPDTQVRLFNLFDKLADELSIQFVLSSHSLTILKEILKKEKRDNENFKIVYLKNPSAPYVAEKKSYELLKADMFGELTFEKTKVKIYFEDTVGEKTFYLLLKAFKNIYIKIKNNLEYPFLRNSENVNDYKAINKRIMDCESIINIEDNLEKIVSELGCEELIKISTIDTYFKQIIFLLDGDARYKDTRQRPLIRNFLNKKYDSQKERLNDRSHTDNICFLPDYFAPESFLFYIVNNIVKNEFNHFSFWRGLESDESTALYTPDKIKLLFNNLNNDFTNDDLKNIFKNFETSKIWQFILKSDIVTYYYSDYCNINELLLFIEKLNKAYEMTYKIVLAKKFS